MPVVAARKNESAVEPEKRRFPRYEVGEGAFAGVYPRVGEIINISRGGVLYQYLDFQAPTASSRYFVLRDSDGDSIDGLPFDIVDDTLVASESSFSRFSARRRRVKFGPLNERQRQALQRFIDKHRV